MGWFGRTAFVVVFLIGAVQPALCQGEAKKPDRIESCLLKHYGGLYRG